MNACFTLRGGGINHKIRFFPANQANPVIYAAFFNPRLKLYDIYQQLDP